VIKKRFLIRFSIVVLGYGAMGGLLRYYGLLIRMHTESKFMVGLALSIGSLVAIIANPYFGSRSDRTWNRLGRRRPYVLLSVPVCALIIAVISYAPSYWILVAGLFMLTVANSIGMIPLFSMIPDNTVSSERGRVISIFMFIAGIGVMTVLAIGWGLWDKNFHLVFLVSAALVILFTIPAAIALTEREPTASELELAAPHHHSMFAYFKNILSHRDLVLFFASNFFRQFSFALMIQFMMLFAKEDLSITVSVASFAMLLQLMSRIVVAPAAGLAADRFQRKTLLVSSLFAIGMGTLICYFWVQNLPTFMVLVIFLGIGEAFLAVSASTMIMDMLPEGRSGEFLGLNSVMQAVPAVIGALVGGIISQMMGQYRAFLLLYAVGMVVSALFVLKIRVPEQSPEP